MHTLDQAPADRYMLACAEVIPLVRNDESALLW